MLKRLTEQLAPSVVRTPATVATKVTQEPEINPEEFEESVPENTLITLEHNRRFDWEAFAGGLLAEVMRVPKEQKPVITHKAPPLFFWHENRSWDAVSRLSHQLDTPTPDPWTCEEYMGRAQDGLRSLEKSATKAPAALNNWIYTWAYIKVPAQNEGMVIDLIYSVSSPNAMRSLIPECERQSHTMVMFRYCMHRVMVPSITQEQTHSGQTKEIPFMPGFVTSEDTSLTTTWIPSPKEIFWRCALICTICTQFWK